MTLRCTLECLHDFTASAAKPSATVSTFIRENVAQDQLNTSEWQVCASPGQQSRVCGPESPTAVISFPQSLNFSWTYSSRAQVCRPPESRHHMSENESKHFNLTSAAH